MMTESFFIASLTTPVSLPLHLVREYAAPKHKPDIRVV
jgi:hypothetical protein